MIVSDGKNVIVLVQIVRALRVEEDSEDRRTRASRGLVVYNPSSSLLDVVWGNRLIDYRAHYCAWRLKKVPAAVGCTAPGDRPLRCGADDESQKTGNSAPSRSTRDCFSGHLFSFRHAVLLFSTRRDPIRNWYFPLQKKKARDDDPRGVFERIRGAFDDARLERRRPFPFLPGGGFLVRGASRFGVRC